ncbi:MAG TPA: hypothetical protein VF844_14715 [Ktedonobacteraceae bacterium]
MSPARSLWQERRATGGHATHAPSSPGSAYQGCTGRNAVIRVLVAYRARVRARRPVFVFDERITVLLVVR